MTGATGGGNNSGSALDGIIVLDLSRMLPGAIAARSLLDLGARLIKIEQPETGDPFRHAPPVLDGCGAGFRLFYRGAESVCLELSDPADAARLRKLARHADVVLESFRPGTLERWDVGPERLLAANPRLVICSLTGYGRQEPWASLPGHDLNFVAVSGLLSLLCTEDVPQAQFADIAAGLLGCSAVLAALLRRQRSGRGGVVEQPLAFAALPFLAWNMAEIAGGGNGLTTGMVAGAAPAYHIYRGGDGRRMALAALEPKFWTAFLKLTGLEHLAPCAWNTGADGQRAIAEIADRLREQPGEHWLRLAADNGLPLSPVLEVEEAMADPVLASAGALRDIALSGSVTAKLPGPFLPSLGRTATALAPSLGQHTGRVLGEFGLATAPGR